MIDFKTEKKLAARLGNFADISYLKEQFMLRRIRDACTMYAGAFGCNSLLHNYVTITNKKLQVVQNLIITDSCIAIHATA